MVQALELENVVFFDGWREDVNSWLQDKHYIVSTSICEGHPVGLLEGMACGLKPVIHNFPGAKDIFPSEFLFNISEEFCGQILSDKYEPQKYRKFVEEKYSLKSQLSRINEIFIQFEAQINGEPSSEATVPIFESPRILLSQDSSGGGVKFGQ
jgi:glycosyltransferase involved in cell wall biosynthesis